MNRTKKQLLIILKIRDFFFIKVDDYSYLERNLETAEEIISFVASWIAENGYYENPLEDRVMTEEEMRKFRGFDMLEKIIKKHSVVKGIVFEIEFFPAVVSFYLSKKQMLDPETVEKLIFGKDSYVQRDIYNN